MGKKAVQDGDTTLLSAAVEKIRGNVSLVGCKCGSFSCKTSTSYFLLILATLSLLLTTYTATYRILFRSTLLEAKPPSLEALQFERD